MDAAVLLVELERRLSALRGNVTPAFLSEWCKRPKKMLMAVSVTGSLDLFIPSARATKVDKGESPKSCRHKKNAKCPGSRVPRAIEE